MAQRGPSGSSRVGLLDLDIFGPSVPKLMGLEDVGEPELTRGESNDFFSFAFFFSTKWILLMAFTLYLRKSSVTYDKPWYPVYVHGLFTPALCVWVQRRYRRCLARTNGTKSSPATLI